MVSKINTTAQIMLAAAVLANIGFGLGLKKSIHVLIILVAVFTILSAMAYLRKWFSHMAGFERS